MRVLVTNDDGIAAPGLSALARALVAEGHDVTVAAPLFDVSGCGAALGVGGEGPVRVEQIELQGLAGTPAYGIDAYPAMAVLACCQGAFGSRPDLVVSGVNRGLNVGQSVLSSGTVGAALTAAHLGGRALAVSLADSSPMLWVTATTLATFLVPSLAASPPGTALSLNVPALVLDQLGGLQSAALSTGVLLGLDGSCRNGRLDMVARATHPSEWDVDTGLVAAGYASVTALRGVAGTAGPPALDDHLRAWRPGAASGRWSRPFPAPTL